MSGIGADANGVASAPQSVWRTFNVVVVRHAVCLLPQSLRAMFRFRSASAHVYVNPDCTGHFANGQFPNAPESGD
jgi:hypothetical protein